MSLFNANFDFPFTRRRPVSNRKLLYTHTVHRSLLCIKYVVSGIMCVYARRLDQSTAAGHRGSLGKLFETSAICTFAACEVCSLDLRRNKIALVMKLLPRKRRNKITLVMKLLPRKRRNREGLWVFFSERPGCPRCGLRFGDRNRQSEIKCPIV